MISQFPAKNENHTSHFNLAADLQCKWSDLGRTARLRALHFIRERQMFFVLPK